MTATWSSRPAAGRAAGIIRRDLATDLATDGPRACVGPIRSAPLMDCLDRTPAEPPPTEAQKGRDQVPRPALLTGRREPRASSAAPGELLPCTNQPC